MYKILVYSAAILFLAGCGRHDANPTEKEKWKLALIQADIDRCVANSDHCIGGFLSQNLGNDKHGAPVIRIRQIANCQLNCEWYQYGLPELQSQNSLKMAAKELYGSSIVLYGESGWREAAVAYARQFVLKKQV